MYTIVWRLSVIKDNIADFLPDAKISNHAFTVMSNEEILDILDFSEYNKEIPADGVTGTRR